MLEQLEKLPFVRVYIDIISPPRQTDHMGNEAAPEFVLDQGLYYPAAADYYGYYCTGTEQPSEWDDQHTYLGLDGQNLQLCGLPTESSPYVYVLPNYEYAESPYNPYNPYIPGAVTGIDGPYIGTQQYFSESSIQQTGYPSYFPFGVQSSSEMPLYTSPDPYPVSVADGKYVPPLSSVNLTTPLKACIQNQVLEPFQPTHQIPIAPGPINGSQVNAASSMHGALTNGVASYMPQSGRGPPEVATPGNRGITYLETNAGGWSPGERIRPRAQFNGFSSRNLVEHNIGPRMNRPHGQLASPLMSMTYAIKDATGNMDGSVIAHVGQYNKDDFAVDYTDAKFFVIKSYSEDDVHKSIKYNVWSSTSSGNKKLDFAYGEAQNEKPRKCPIFLFFSVNASGYFCGVAEMIGPVDFHKDMDFWLQGKWTGSFPVKWHMVKDVPNPCFRHIILVNNEHRPVTSSRDTQEVPYLPGMNMLTIFKNSPMTTSILDDYMFFEERERSMQEEKSRLLPRKSNRASVFLPTSNKLDSAINQPIRTVGSRLDDMVVQAPAASDQNEPNTEDNGKADRNTVDQDQAKGKQQNVARWKPLSRTNQLKSPTANALSRTNGDISDNSKPPSSDGTQLNHEVNQLREASPKQIKHPVGFSVPGKFGSSEDGQDCRDASPIALSSEREIDEANVAELLTVGSMQIKIDEQHSFMGPLTIGMVRVELKGLKI